MVLKKAAFDNPYMTKDMRRMILKFALMRRIKRGSVYSYAILKEFDNERVSGFLKSSSAKNDIYNTLKMLEEKGYVSVRNRAEGGRVKRYYNITPKGARAVAESRRLFLATMSELMKVVR